jgi:hypothetical protein
MAQIHNIRQLKSADVRYESEHFGSDFAQFLTGPSSAQRPPTKMADPPMESTFDPLHT